MKELKRDQAIARSEHREFGWYWNAWETGETIDEFRETDDGLVCVEQRVVSATDEGQQFVFGLEDVSRRPTTAEEIADLERWGVRDPAAPLGAFGEMAKRTGTKPRELSSGERVGKLDALLGKPVRND